ncbi:MAG: InlB B-repeat-containing protein, partial [Lachnospiraceae bacterium]|nr:InlB B-repeat-containing protein [Lachnospiraceae bacterium]
MNGKKMGVRKNFRKALSLLLTLCLLLGMIPDAAFAQEETGTVSVEAATEAVTEAAASEGESEAEETGASETDAVSSFSTEAETQAATEAAQTETSAAAEAETQAAAETTQTETSAETETASIGTSDSNETTSTESSTETMTTGTEAAAETEQTVAAAVCSHGNQADECAICEAEALIDALPSVAELSAMDTEELNDIYDQASAICDSYYELSDDEQEQVSNIDALWDVLDYFNGSISTADDDTGDFVVTGGTYGTDYKYSDGTLTILTSTELTIANSDSATATSNHIVVSSGVGANIILNGVNIKTTGSSSEITACPLYLADAGESTITLAEDSENTLDASSLGGSDPIGLWAPNGYLLTITGSGTLTVKGGSYCPGIGRRDANSNILIESGTIIASSSLFGAGIGGGRTNAGGTITITGGNVTATGGGSNSSYGGGAGIGGGAGNDTGTNITISGGTVTATGGSDSKGGAGIGSGYGGSSSTITISGGYVSAAPGSSASAIGAGSGGSAATVTITGGYFGTGDTVAETVYGITVAETYGVNENTESSSQATYPYVVNQNFTISYVIGNDGTITGNNVTSYAYGDAVILPTADDIICTSGYAFGGWYESSDYSGTAVTEISSTDYGDKTYYAKIVKSSQTVTFDSNCSGAVANPSAITVNYGEAYGELPTLSMEGYIFNGWYTDPDDGTEVASTTVVSAEDDHTLYAHWGCGHSEYSAYGFCEECGYYQPADYNNSGYYEISNPGQLLWFAALVNSDTSSGLVEFTDDDTARGTSANAVLTADVDMGSYGSQYVPIGRGNAIYNNSVSSVTAASYKGTFDGQGHVISNLTVSAVTTNDIGIFGSLSGTVKNLGVRNFSNEAVTADARGGAIAGQICSGGNVENCYVQSSVISCTGKVAGGLAGANYSGTVKNCYVVGTSVTASRTGSIVGDNADNGNYVGTITNCYTDGSNLVVSNTSYSGTVSGCETSVSSARFASGEVAWLLQNGQSDNSVLVWGQSLTVDSYPVLTSTESLRVLYVPFTDTVTSNIVEKAYVNNGSTYDSYPESGDYEYEFYTDSGCTDDCKIDTSTYTYTFSNASDSNTINIYIFYELDPVDYIDENGEPQSCDEYTIITSDMTELTDGWYAVISDVTISDRITVSGEVHLILVDGYTLTASSGITVSSGNTLNIYGQSGGTGALSATGASNNAGIGGTNGNGCGTITINGGTITAAGGENGAGIGGGYKGTGQNITINGGTVTATGGSRGAGIGGGRAGTGSYIVINGGTVTATGGAYATGIGGGDTAAGSYITINGGTVTATGPNGGAGIGGGDGSSNGTGSHITITGGIVTASSDNGAGIGGGYQKAGTDITISGGYILASANTGSPIGGGAGGSASNITITGGYFGKGDTSADTVYDVNVATGYGVTESGIDTYPYMVGEKSYTVSFEDGHDGSYDEMTVTYGSTYGELPTLEIEGYVFVGWYTEKDGAGDLVESDTVVSITENQILYAYCVDTTVTVTFDPDDGTVSPETMDVTYQTAYGSLPAAEKDWYVFGSWNTESDGSGDTITSESIVSTYEDHILYAIYTQEPIGYIDENGDEQTCEEYTLLTSDMTTLSDGWYVVGSDIEFTGSITISGEVYLILVDGYTLDADYGVIVNTGNTLNIYGQSGGTGTLNATGTNGSAGIGSAKSTDAGTIIINGGTINAQGAYDGAGIGGGERGNGGVITINGGTIAATGYTNSTGIGGGLYGTAGTITINGGNITATSGETNSNKYGACGIGSGHGASGGTITITGGVINASSPSSAGYGIGWATLEITGGYIIAYGQYTGNLASGTITGGYFGTGSVSANTVYSRSVASGYGVYDNTEATKEIYPYVVLADGTEYTVTLVIENAEVTGNNIESYVVGTEATLPTTDDITCDTNYAFTGWYADEDCTDGPYTSISSTTSGNKTYYARMVAPVTVTLDSNGGKCETASLTVTYGGTYGELPDPTYDWHTFTGWYSAADGGTQVTENTVVETEEAHTLYACWEQEPVDYIDENGDIRSCEEYTLITSDMTELSSGWYLVGSNVTISDRIVVSGDVHLILADGYTLDADSGITVNSDASLTIYGQSGGTGELNATSETDDYAGIGSDGYGNSSGTITINGGTITANGGRWAAGIGGSSECAANITINGGTITATGGEFGAGI